MLLGSLSKAKFVFATLVNSNTLDEEPPDDWP